MATINTSPAVTVVRMCWDPNLGSPAPNHFPLDFRYHPQRNKSLLPCRKAPSYPKPHPHPLEKSSLHPSVPPFETNALPLITMYHCGVRRWRPSCGLGFCTGHRCVFLLLYKGWPPQLCWGFEKFPPYHKGEKTYFFDSQPTNKFKQTPLEGWFP